MFVRILTTSPNQAGYVSRQFAPFVLQDSPQKSASLIGGLEWWFG